MMIMLLSCDLLQRMLAEMKLLSHCIVVGDEQRYLTKLVTLCDCCSVSRDYSVITM